jgi:ATP-dependent exoDNAse (exonuclease V) beta subunit
MSNTSMNPQEQLAADQAARQAALDAARSFIIDAPAGAGKTELLTQRFLKLLTCVDDPEEIIALTFTNKAAAEMRDRIMQSLRSATQPLSATAPPHKRTTYDLACAVLDRDQKRQWQLVQQPGRLRVMTLDALSARIARQMPLLSRFGTQPAIATDPTPYYEQAARNTLDLLEDGTPESDTVAQALTYFDNDSGRLQRMLVAMLARRDQWLKHAYQSDPASLQQDVGRVLRELVASRLQRIADRISISRQESFMAAARYAAALSPESPIHRLADWHEPLGADPEQLPLWRAVAELFLTGKNELRKTYQKPINLAGAAHQAQKQVLLDANADLAATGDATTLADIRALPDPQLDATEAAIVTHLAALLKLAAAQLWLVFIREKKVDFSEIAQRASEALGNDDAPTEIRERLDYRISHLLIDEFQDTSPLQVQLLQQVTAGWEDDPTRSVFLVGDPMQSIYRFRKADVGLFLRVRNRGLGKLQPERLQLYLNNRSYAEIIDWVNETFEWVFAPVDNMIDGAVTYTPSVANKGRLAQAGISIHPIISGDRDPDTGGDAPKSLADEREAVTIIELIRRAREENPDGTIAILVSARSHLDALVDLLQHTEPRLPFQAVEIDALGARQPIQDLVSLTRALHQPADRVHWLATLRAPWCGLTLQDLNTLAADDHQQTLWALMQDEARINQLSSDGHARLLPLRQTFAEAYSHQGLQRPRRWVEGVWHALGGPACLSHAAEIEDVTAYFQLLDELDDRGALDLSRLDASLGRLFAAPDCTPDSQHIQLMTIHKSKGLEFDTVILPGLHRTPPPDDKGLLLWDNSLLDDGREHLVVAPAPPPGSPESSTPTPYNLLYRLERTRAQNEDRRVLYVAVTRAIRRLHLLGIVSRDGKSSEPGALKEPAASSLLSPLWPALAPAFAEAALALPPSSPAASLIDPANFVPKLIRVVTPIEIREPISQEVQIAEETGTAFGSTLDMDVGTLIHQYLEAFASDGLEAWTAERISALQPRFARHLSSLGHEAETVATAAAIVHDTLQNALRDDLSRWILGPHGDAGCEVPLSGLANAEDTDEISATDFQRHVIDRTFIDDNTRWIIDYKTLRIDYPQDLDAVLKAKAESYRPQLQRYAALYAHEIAQGLQIRTAIFFPAHGKLIEL